ncbi:twin-arginine translocase TatA/TatE family subunit [Acidianus sulfidivorans JP7]|uniref:Twin-arginine translocase TatA/TatE family subunit n=1 Tax=Acidianus sulfidivorans JP7 TaxID=619593 RepID=A0A2U9IPV5_9CREN|nr:twin-arginine translocase TatA/TatE family subunit [Acidianus sulfidivorans]AWR98033.1 twin-arginine translocase TatA/TatE family subunit [Acidianus sulfidivorans JP7]
MFGNLAPTDILIILIVAALVFFGASKIPEIFRNMGKAVGEFKKGRIESEMEINQMQQALQPQVQNTQPQVQQTQNNQNIADLEKQIKQLQDQLEQLKKQQTSQS